MPTPFIASGAPKRPAAPPPRDESSRDITFKWQSETATITVPDGSTPVQAAAAQFRLPLERITLVWKGKRYKHQDAVVDASDDL
eukprot:CAMPEP_0119281890 /NCGR_PEP_ID=MMETSP1329-20130426/25726_1 /TAXON_ID=114041 /ORGANISM="Genus nov. species nov., Strain RCC1024" /LENGTH=83 /DNA_ID=CAMNT_0007282529 /DNA_START=89 /DNA_END=337 /DNA_ORIENTATION=+